MKKNKNAINTVTQEIIFYANNCNKIGTKIESFNKVLSDLKPAIFGLEETKQKINDPPIKCDNLTNYQTFELRREKEKEFGGKGLEGGGLAIGALHCLKPLLTRQGDDDSECLSISIKTIPMDILCVVGYGPQIGDRCDRKNKFWNYLEEEADSAEKHDMGLIIQLDSNAWAGDKIIPKDKNPQNTNGKLLQQFLQNNPALTVVNSLQCCEGSITRQRKTTTGDESAILDLFIVCQKILPHVKHMKIDHDGQYWLTNYSSKRKVNKVTHSDHFPVILALDMSFKVAKPQRTSQFNFKDKYGQMNFFEMTDKNKKLSEIFSTQTTFENQVSMFEKTMNSIYHQSFSKIREKKRKFKEDDVGFLIEKIKKLKSNPSSEENTKALENVEDLIIEKTEQTYAERVFEALGNITGEDGKVSNMGAWRQLNKIDPYRKKKQVLPMSFKDKYGNLITNYDNIKEHCLTNILHRLRKRQMHPELLILEQRKLKLSRMRLLMAKRRKTAPWTLKQMEKAIKSMKNRKCRDAQGLVNEILQPGVAGRDFKMALLSLMNNTKKHLKIPHMMKIVNIALIPKPGKRNLQHIENHRGIFLIHKFRSLLMRMLLNDKYDTLDEFMSDSNVGGRKGRSVRDHLFIVNGVIQDHHNSKDKHVTFQILDYSLCFDSMWYEEVTNELYEAGIQNDKLALIAKINESNDIAIQTPLGLTRRENVKRIICQGDPWGSIECSLMVDGFGKDSLHPELQPYKYKSEVAIPLLGMVDDVFIISESGYKAQRFNGFINAKTAIKRLQFGRQKCQVMHIGKHIPKHKKANFYVDGWIMKEQNDIETNMKESTEKFNGEDDIEETENTKYLGQIIS